MKLLNISEVILSVIFIVGCAGDFEEQRNQTADDHQSDAIGNKGQKYGEATGGFADETDHDSNDGNGIEDADDENNDTVADGDNDGIDDSDTGNTDTDNTNTDNNSLSSRKFFAETIVPGLTSHCASCHADPRFNPPVQAPLTIFNFKRMENLLGNGDGALTNDLYAKISGSAAHGGGDRCNESPQLCDLVIDWWQSLYGDGSAPSQLVGQLSLVTEDGRVNGWAADRVETTTSIPIRVFSGGDANTGTLIYETDANLAGYDNGTSGNHAFSIALPEQFRDGTPQSISVYGIVEGDLIQLPGSPQTFTAYTPNPNGEAFYENNIKTILLNRCGSCHAVDYSIQWASLLSPAPNKGGTATNNELIGKPGGTINHGGGNLCGGINGTPCSLFQDWWEIEFAE